MEKFSIKPNTGQIIRAYLFISLTLPAMPAIVSLFDFVFNRQTFSLQNYYEGYLYMSALGAGIFIIMVLGAIPALRKEKVAINEYDQVVLSLAFKKPQAMHINEISVIDRGYKPAGNGKVQVVNIYSATNRLTFELKKYAPEDVENLIARLKVANPQLSNRYSESDGFKKEIIKYFKN